MLPQYQNLWSFPSDIYKISCKVDQTNPTTKDNIMYFVENGGCTWFNSVTLMSAPRGRTILLSDGFLFDNSAAVE